MTRHPKHTRSKASPPPPQEAEGAPPEGSIVPAQGPSFAQPVFSPDPTQFKIYHGSDSQAYKSIDAYNKSHKASTLPFPLPRGVDADKAEPVLTLQQVLNGNKDAVDAITDAGQIVFHALGDSGSTRGPETQNEVTDKLESDFEEASKADVPSFLFHLGDVVYSFGEEKYYFDQFYDAYRDYPAPVLAIPGNHDGMVAPGSTVPTLDAFLRNFCQEKFVFTPEAGGLSRTAQIQPGVFYTFEAPFVRILALYSGTLEDPGVIADDHIGDAQLKFLKAALTRVKKENYKGALIIAHHHPAYTHGAHGWSKQLTASIDKICTDTGIWPHAVLSGHAHNYQRFTRTHEDMQIPYLVNGNGGHPPLQRLARKSSPPLRVPATLKGGEDGDSVVFESYDDQDYGYLRLIANKTTLRIEYHPASDGPLAKTPDDAVTVDLANRTIS